MYLDFFVQISIEKPRPAYVLFDRKSRDVYCPISGNPICLVGVEILSTRDLTEV